MSARCWRTDQPIDPAFERDWEATLPRLAYAHFGYRLDFLRWRQRHETTSLAVLIEEPGFTGAVIARLEDDTWVCGRPWRWSASVVADGRSPVESLRPGEAITVFEHLERFAEGRRVRAHLPAAPPAGIPGYQSGKTLLHKVDVSDDQLLGAMDKTKRASIRRATREGWRVVEAAEEAQFRGFAEVQRETSRRHGLQPLDGPEDKPGPGERWREWELPWMWLLVAERNGEIASGFGHALSNGSVVESRAAASTSAALKAGVFVLVAWESLRRARERGYRFLNWGGDTFFKRDVAGDLGHSVPLHCWLGGGLRWRFANQSEVLVHVARGGAAGLLHALRAATGRGGG